MNAQPLRNVLFIMCDQLRHDHLGFNGHPHLRTPNLDRLASRSTCFDQAYVQAGVCGPSRMSYYTGRYVSSHGVTWNRVPLSVAQRTLGDHLRAAGRTFHLVGKSHVIPDVEGLLRLGVNKGSATWRHVAAGGFTEIDRIDGHAEPGPESGYGDYLRHMGYAGDRPWHDYVASGVDEQGHTVSGWFLRNVHLPARVREAHSETAYVTDTALAFLERTKDRPFALHLSYVKPHWPYIAPAPYHQTYGPEHMLPIRKHPAERQDPHPVLAAYQAMEESITFSDEAVVRQVRPVYMGLIEQVDHHIGRVLEFLERHGLMEHTLIVFTSDHGDYGGDHHLGEKDLFHDQVVRVPLLVHDPRPQADTTRGQHLDHFVQAIDVAPTLLEALGIRSEEDGLQGMSLLNGMHGTLDTPDHASLGIGARDCVISEIDYSFRRVRLSLQRRPGECRGWMVRTRQWKYIHWQGFRPQLYDLQHDPYEYMDLGQDPGLEPVRREMEARLLAWMAALHPRQSLSDTEVARRTDRAKEHGIYYGTWSP
ncbi:MAG: sulfatase-like hydrolase/transferase [Betaproteobacteria bacterium]|jgi:arylsulfatase A-like enzyme